MKGIKRYLGNLRFLKRFTLSRKHGIAVTRAAFTCPWFVLPLFQNTARKTSHKMDIRGNGAEISRFETPKQVLTDRLFSVE